MEAMGDLKMESQKVLICISHAIQKVLKKVTFRKNIASVIFRDVIKIFTKIFPKWKALFDQTLKQKFVFRDN